MENPPDVTGRGGGATDEFGLFTNGEATVDLGAIGHNVSILAATAAQSGAATLAVVKADGFGHGMLQTARATLSNGAGWLGVATLAKALALRAAGIDAPSVAARHTAGTNGGDSAGARREIWADAAKGACILMVVLWHVVEKHYIEITWRISLPIPGVWGTLVEQLLPLRMPLFFTISGLFAANAVNRPWPVVRQSKVARFYYLFLLWVLIHTAVLSLSPDFDTARARSPLELLEEITITPPNLWYLYALALYFTVAKAVRWVPPAVVLGGAFVLSAVAAAGLIATPGNRGGLYQNLFFFLAGLYFRPFVERLARDSNLRRLVLAGAAFAGALLAMRVTRSQEWPLVWPLVSIVAVVFGVTAAGQVSRWPALGNGLAALGRRTLPIYVIHMPILALLDWPLYGPLSTVDARWQLLFAVVEPAALTTVVVVVCLVLETALRKVGATWLFELPGRGGRREAPRHAATQQPQPASRPFPPHPADSAAQAPTVPLPVVEDSTMPLPYLPGMATTHPGNVPAPGRIGGV